MSRTIVQQKRASDDLMAFMDTRAGNLKDQSGNGITYTIPSDAHFSKDGLRCFTDSMTFPLDMSAVQNFCAFALVKGWQPANGIKTHIMGINPDSIVVVNGWGVFQTTDETVRCFYNIPGTGQTGSLIAWPTRTDSYFVAFHLDRRLSYQSVKGYFRGIDHTTVVADLNDNDGSTFKNGIIHLMGNNGATIFANRGLMQVFGIIDCTTNQLTPEDYVQLYTEIRDRKTI